MQNLLNVLAGWYRTLLPSQQRYQIFLLFFGLVAILAYFGYRMANDVAPTSCSAGEFPIRCYHIRPRMCETIWAKSEVSCKEYVQKLALPPGRLTGPILQKCQLATFDAAFGPSRKSNAECDQMHFDLEEWKRRSDFK